jgi:hypothetical protein
VLAFDQFYIIADGGPQNMTVTTVYRGPEKTEEITAAVISALGEERSEIRAYHFPQDFHDQTHTRSLPFLNPGREALR